MGTLEVLKPMRRCMGPRICMLETKCVLKHQIKVKIKKNKNIKIMLKTTLANRTIIKMIITLSSSKISSSTARDSPKAYQYRTRISSLPCLAKPIQHLISKTAEMRTEKARNPSRFQAANKSRWARLSNKTEMIK